MVPFDVMLGLGALSAILLFGLAFFLGYALARVQLFQQLMETHIHVKYEDQVAEGIAEISAEDEAWLREQLGD